MYSKQKSTHAAIIKRNAVLLLLISACFAPSFHILALRHLLTILSIVVTNKQQSRKHTTREY